MSVPFALERGTPPPWRERLLPLAVVVIARAAALLPPVRLRALLLLARRGASPATPTATLRARQVITGVSAYCAGEGCVPRSVATALLCRLHGSWPDWFVGVRTEPFAAHAWVEVDGKPIGERHPAGYYTPVMSVPAVPRP
jgi:hypothetical protein